MFHKDALSGLKGIISGGSSGIGLGMAKYLVEHGAEITITGRNEEKLVNAQKEIGSGCHISAGDVRQADDVNKNVTDHMEKYGQVDFLINNAAGNFLCSLEDMSENAFASVMGIVTHGTFLFCKAVFPHMKKARSGKIINTGATYAWGHAAMVAHSGAAKAAVLNLTRSMAVEWGPFNIQTNMVAPGPVEDTEGVKRLMAHPNLGEKLLKMVPTPRMAKAEEIAQAVTFLLHPSQSYLNGIALPIDGGMNLVIPGLMPAGLDMIMKSP